VGCHQSSCANGLDWIGWLAGEPGQEVFECKTVRYNPSVPGAVTGSATYVSFFSSLVRARGLSPGLHLC